MFIFKKKNKESKENKEIEESKEVNKYSFINSSTNLKECIICLDRMCENEKLTLLMCSHIYHKKCIDIWLEKKSICPICDTLI